MPTVEWGEAGPEPSTPAAQPPPPPPSETAEQLRLWPLPHPQSSPSATASSPLLPPPHHWHVCALLAPLLFARPPSVWLLAFCWGERRSSQLPSPYLLTLRWEVSKSRRNRMEILDYPLRLLGWALGSVKPSCPAPPHCCLPYHPLHGGLPGQDCDLSHLYPSKRALPCIPHFSRGG